jgi:hypothetical protein
MHVEHVGANLCVRPPNPPRADTQVCPYRRTFFLLNQTQLGLKIVHRRELVLPDFDTASRKNGLPALLRLTL